MRLDDIKAAILSHRHELHADPLPTEGKGYSFWLGAPAHSNRILRVSQNSPTAPIKVRLAVDNRLRDQDKRRDESEFTFHGNVAALLAEVDEEIASFRKHLAREEG
ncbi:hypothetical protein [Noviherbaspirillum pedocola]|uniref:Uncharacterized protein n=1 Tax=Noviherbaspirillum pedocola TaxID=2801341 RepID=A0A934W6B3_9BURK|nr:hypothetical protein [Noviherbaspirillum pedocola]MBK4736002.1 hypothetical protein [Noviherbaspirillum pedocola]